MTLVYQLFLLLLGRGYLQGEENGKGGFGSWVCNPCGPESCSCKVCANSSLSPFLRSGGLGRYNMESSYEDGGRKQEGRNKLGGRVHHEASIVERDKAHHVREVQCFIYAYCLLIGEKHRNCTS